MSLPLSSRPEERTIATESAASKCLTDANVDGDADGDVDIEVDDDEDEDENGGQGNEDENEDEDVSGPLECSFPVQSRTQVEERSKEEQVN